MPSPSLQPTTPLSPMMRLQLHWNNTLRNQRLRPMVSMGTRTKNYHPVSTFIFKYLIPLVLSLCSIELEWQFIGVPDCNNIIMMSYLKHYVMQYTSEASMCYYLARYSLSRLQDYAAMWHVIVPSHYYQPIVVLWNIWWALPHTIILEASNRAMSAIYAIYCNVVHCFFPDEAMKHLHQTFCETGESVHKPVCPGWPCMLDSLNACVSSSLYFSLP